MSFENPKRFPLDIPSLPGEIRGELPTAETTAFNQPEVQCIVDSIDFILDYTSPQANGSVRSKTVQALCEFSFQQRKFHTFDRTLANTIERIQNSDASLPRFPLYRLVDLQERMQDAYIKSDFIGTRNIPAELPKEIPYEDEAFSRHIVHAWDAIVATYPHHAGTVIPPLTRRDILVASDRDVLLFQKLQSAYDSHPYRVVAAQKYFPEENGIGEKFGRKESAAMIQALSRPEGHLIIYPRSVLTIEEKMPPQLKLVVRYVSSGRELIHESMHNTIKPTDPIPVTNDNPLVDMAFGPERIKLAVSKGEDRERHLKYYDDIRTYAMEHNPHIVIEGARVQLWCGDEEGRLRMMTDAGYDLNEGIVEQLTYKAMPHIFARAREQFPVDMVKRVESAIHRYAYSDDTYRYLNMLSVVPEYAKNLGITSVEALLDVYARNELPMLHMKHTPKDRYFP